MFGGPDIFNGIRGDGNCGRDLFGGPDIFNGVSGDGNDGTNTDARDADDARPDGDFAIFFNASERFASALLFLHVSYLSPTFFLVALKLSAPFFPTFFSVSPVLRYKADNPFLAPSFINWVPLITAYNAGAPVLSFSLSLSAFSDFENELSLLLLCPNFLATSRASSL